MERVFKLPHNLNIWYKVLSEIGLAPHLIHSVFGQTCNTAQNSETSAGSLSFAIERSRRRVCHERSGVDALKSDLDEGEEEEEPVVEAAEKGDVVGDDGDGNIRLCWPTGDAERREEYSILTLVILAHKTNLTVVAREERYGLSQRIIVAASFHCLDTREAE